MSRAIRRYGWRPSLPDHRDLVADPSGIELLPEVDPRPDMTPVYDQGQLGSCTANAVAAAVDYDRIVHGEPSVSPARLGIYYLERLLEGQPPTQDTGAMGRDGFKACSRIGYLPEADWPYFDSLGAYDFQTDPRHSSAWARDHLLLERPYKAVPRTVLGIKALLSNRQSVAFGFTVHESFESQQVASSGIVPVPKQGERIMGGHEVLAVGYLAKQPHHVLCRNSWGEGWGLGGYFLFPWVMLLDPHTSGDLRTIYTPA